jgi:plastocyanin
MRRALLPIAIVLLVAGACSSSKTSSPPVSLPGTVNNHGTKSAGATLTLEAHDFYFNPTFLKAVAGERIIVTLKNEGKKPHTFTSDALGIDQRVDPGQTATLNLTAPASGSAAWHCKFHQSQGMQGALYIG